MYRETSLPWLRVPPVTQHRKLRATVIEDILGDKAPPNLLHIPPTTTDPLDGLTKKEEVELEEEEAEAQGEEKDLEMEEDLAVEAEGHKPHHHLHLHHIAPPQPALVTPTTTITAHPATNIATGAWEGQVTIMYSLAHVVIDLIAHTIPLHRKTTRAYLTLAINHGSGTGIFQFYQII